VIRGDLPHQPRPEQCSTGTYLKETGLQRSAWLLRSMLLLCRCCWGCPCSCAQETGDLSDARRANVVQLGLKELWSLARDPINAVLIVFVIQCRSIAGATVLPEIACTSPDCDVG